MANKARNHAHLSVLEIKQLKKKLCYLAGEWRRYESPSRQEEIAREYRAIILRLLDSPNWDVQLPIEALLPEELMPGELLQRYPHFLDVLDAPWPKRSNSSTSEIQDKPGSSEL